MTSRIVDGLVETVSVIGALTEGISLLFTGIIFLAITAAISGVMFWFAWLLLFGRASRAVAEPPGPRPAPLLASTSGH